MRTLLEDLSKGGYQGNYYTHENKGPIVPFAYQILTITPESSINHACSQTLTHDQDSPLKVILQRFNAESGILLEKIDYKTNLVFYLKDKRTTEEVITKIKQANS